MSQQMLFSRISGEEIEKLRREIKKGTKEKAKVEKALREENEKLAADLEKSKEKLQESIMEQNELKIKQNKLIHEVKVLKESNAALRQDRQSVEEKISAGVEKESRRLINEMRDSFLKHSMEEKERMDASLKMFQESTISKKDHFLAMDRLKKEFDSVKEALHNHYARKNRHMTGEPVVALGGIVGGKPIEFWEGESESGLETAKEDLYNSLSPDSLG